MRLNIMFSSKLWPRLGACAAVSVAAAALLAPAAASAQDVPSYARPSYVISTDETVHGRIRSVDGAFNISVDDDRGFVDSVELHQGTIINPTGLTLSPGMSVTILGTNAGSAFSANEIDTPYTYDGPLPTPVYYGPGYWCPGFAYGYGPSFSLAIVIGGGGPWSYEHRPFYGRPWDGHAYFGGYVGAVPVARGRVEERRSYSGPAERSAVPVRNAPAAFAPRAGYAESRASTDRFAGRSENRSALAARQIPTEHRAAGAASASGAERGGGHAGAQHGGEHGGGDHGGDRRN
jgi:hypothetical protein